jgi:glycosyltransferase involved in cell wall biosynthesis
MSITVIVLSYRYGHLVSQAIESVLSQTRQPDKILVIDDGVGDCRHVPKLYPEVEFHERHKNLGQLKSFQDALSRVETKRYMILGADNWLSLDALERLEKEEADIVSYDIIVVGAQRSEWCTNYTDARKQEDGTFYWSREGEHHGSMLINTALAKKVGYGVYISKLGLLCEDRFLYDGMRQKGASYFHIPFGLLFYRRHKENFNSTI